MMKKNVLAATSVVVFGVALVTSAASAHTATSPYAETHAISKHKLKGFAERVSKASDGKLKFDVYTGGTVLGAKSSLDGIGDGVAQYGHVTGAYVASDLPLDNVVNDLSIGADDPLAAALAATEVKFNNATLQEEYARNGVVFGAGYSMTNYYLICKKPVRDLGDLKGIRVRTGSNAQVKWAQHVGAVSVSVPATEIYTGLERGSVDCALGDASFLTTSFKLQEVADYVTLLPVGTHTSGGEFFNAKFWRARSEQERKLLLDKLAESMAALQVYWSEQQKKSFEEAKDNRVEFIEPTGGLNQSFDTFVEGFIKDLPKAAMADRRVKDPSQLVEQYLAAEKKWKEKLEGVDRTNVEQVADLIKAGLYRSIDVKQYGR
jgi:TRAP-type C4-dicarboxylate transport system substrate-binding protein